MLYRTKEHNDERDEMQGATKRYGTVEANCSIDFAVHREVAGFRSERRRQNHRDRADYVSACARQLRHHLWGHVVIQWLKRAPGDAARKRKHCAQVAWCNYSKAVIRTSLPTNDIERAV